jgi:endonuclease-3
MDHPTADPAAPPPARGRLGPTSSPERRAAVIVRRLASRYPQARTSLAFDGPWQLLVATVLSAQCTDARVNSVTPVLFGRWPTPADLAAAPEAEVEEVIRPTGFFRAKTRSIRAAGAYLVAHHDGTVPRTTAELVRVPGVGRKTAAVVLGSAFGIAEGIAVDTHAGRLSRRLGLISAVDPVEAERELMAVVPRRHWIVWTHLLIEHGRAICRARVPRCEACVLLDLCPTGRERIGTPRRAARATGDRSRARRA